MVKETFLDLIGKYSNDPNLPYTLWREIEDNYSEKKRHYHNLGHLENLLEQLTHVKDQVREWDTILFTLYYHDVVYNASKNDNEEKSAALAEIRMNAIPIPKPMVDQCVAQILATKKHLVSEDNDTNLFTDADLSVLGQEWNLYEAYFKNVRKEYSIYPDLLYKPGRKKVLQHFLSMERIYKTDYFFAKFEKSAKENLGKELLLV